MGLRTVYVQCVSIHFVKYTFREFTRTHREYRFCKYICKMLWPAKIPANPLKVSYSPLLADLRLAELADRPSLLSPFASTSLNDPDTLISPMA
jgi:hypothetical protein